MSLQLCARCLPFYFRSALLGILVSTDTPSFSWQNSDHAFATHTWQSWGRSTSVRRFMTYLLHGDTREVTRSRYDSVPNFILAFIPAQINRDTLNTMTAFAVRVYSQAHTGPIRRGTHLLSRLVDCSPTCFCISFLILFSESTRMRPFIS